MRRALATLFALTALLPGLARALDTTAPTALVVDHATGAVLLEKNADTPLPPASMSKLMTLNMLFEALADGRLTMEDQFRVSARAAAMGGSKMFVTEGESVRVEDLIHGVIVQSGNDACVVIAEALSGSEEAFARQMTERGREIGLTASTFTNSTGWPDPGQRMSARDLVTLARRIITEFPQYYTYFAHTEFTWAGIVQRNRNPLLGLNIGADGLKTGHTEEAGYGLVGSGVQDDQRVILMIAGLDSDRARLEEAERLMSWAFRDFTNRTLFKAGETLGTADVWLGARDRVPLVAGADLVATLPHAGIAGTTLSIQYRGPIPAPIAAGQEIAALEIRAPGLAPVSVPLLAGEAVPEAGYLGRVSTALGALMGQVAGAQ